MNKPEIATHVPEPPDLSASFKPLDSPVAEAIRKQVSLPHADYVLLHALTHRGLVLKLNPDPGRWTTRWAGLPRIPIPDGEYIKVILHLRATGLVEFDGERDVSAIRLSAKGEAWARGEGLLPTHPAAEESRGIRSW